MTTRIPELIDQLIADHGLNPTLEKRTALRDALGISAPTQWRHEKRLGLRAEIQLGVGGPHLFETRHYLEAMLSERTSVDGEESQKQVAVG